MLVEILNLKSIKKHKGSGRSIIPGASAYTPQQIYRISKEIGRFPAPQTKIEAEVPNFNNGVPPRIVPSVSPNCQDRIKSQLNQNIKKQM